MDPGSGRGRGMSNLPAWMTTGASGGPVASMAATAAVQNVDGSAMEIKAEPLGMQQQPGMANISSGPAVTQSYGGIMPSYGMPQMMGGLPARGPAAYSQATYAPISATPQSTAPAGSYGINTGAANTASSSLTATSTLPAPTAQSEKNYWKEYKDASGRTYYHDQRTNKTTYEKPECLKTMAERTLAPCKWKEYASPDGRKYYSDGVNSMWTEPPELTEYKAKAAALNGGESSGQSTIANGVAASNTAVLGAAGAAASLPAAASVTGVLNVNSTGASASKQAPGERKRGHSAPAAPLVFNSQEERVGAFLEMLRDMEISSQHKWADVARICGDDPRWTALKTTGQKKQNLSEYQTKRMKEEKEERRSRQRKAKENFLILLAEDTTITSRTRWREAQQRLSSNDRYMAIDDDREREDLFNEFIVELARKDEDERREARKAREVGFIAMLKEMRTVDFRSRWLDVRAELELKRDSRYQDLDESDRRHIFHDFITDLRKKAEIEMREREKERRAEEKSKRDAFLANLNEKVAEGAITAVSSWRDCKLDLEKEPTYIALEGQPPSTARQIFDSVVDTLEKAYKDDRKYMRDLLSDSQTPMTHETTFEGFFDILEKSEGTAANGTRRLVDMRKKAENHLRFFFDEVLAKEVSYHEEKLRRKKMREDRYLDLLEEYYYRSDHVGIPWKEAEYDMERRTAFREMPEVDRKRMYDDHMAALERKLGKKMDATKKLDGAEKQPSSSNDTKHQDLEDGEVDKEFETVHASGTGDTENHDDADSDRKRDKKSKKKKKKRDRERSRSFSSSGSYSDGYNSGDDRKKSKKKKSKRSRN